MTASTSAPKLPVKKRIIFSLIVAAIVFLILEAAMILLDPLLFRGFYQYDPDLGFKVRPYTMDSNRFGFNAADFDLHKPDGRYRILILGDSFNWVGGRDANYTSYIQHRFDDDFGTDRVEVINAGYPMTHTAEQLDVLTKYGLQYSPDFVLLGFFIGNDFIDANPHRKRIVVNDSYVDIDRRHEMTIFGYPIVPHSRLLIFIWQKLRVLKEFGIRAAHAMMSEDTFIEIRFNQLQFFDINKQRDNFYQPNIEYILNALTQMNRLLTTKNIRFAVSVFPDQLQVDQTLFNTVAKFGDREPNEFDLGRANHILAAHLNNENIPYVDLLPVFEQANEQEALYIEFDTHWNNKGNRLAANVIYEFLLQEIDATLR